MVTKIVIEYAGGWYPIIYGLNNIRLFPKPPISPSLSEAIDNLKNMLDKLKKEETEDIAALYMLRNKLLRHWKTCAGPQQCGLCAAAEEVIRALVRNQKPRGTFIGDEDSYD